MKKRLLFSLFAVLATVGVSAHNTGEFAYTTTQRFKMTGDNMLVNGQFSPDASGWTDAAGENVSLTGWSVEQAAGPNGEVNALLFTGTESTASLCQVVDLAPSTTYAVSFWIKGEVAGNLTSTLIFVNGDGTREKAASTAEAPVIDVLSSCNYSDEWTEVTAVVTTPVGAADPEDATVTYIATPTLVINFSSLGAGVMVADFSVNEAMEVFDIRLMQERFDYARKLMEEPAFNTADAQDAKVALQGTIEQLEEMIALGGFDEDIATGEDLLPALEELIEAYLAVTSLNVNNLLKGTETATLTGVGKLNRGDNAGLTSKFPNLELTGGNWQHSSNADYLFTAIQGNYTNSGTYNVFNVDFPAGKYFITGKVRNASVGSSAAYVYTYDLETMCKVFVGNDSTEFGPVAGENYQRFYFIGDVNEDGAFRAGIEWPGKAKGSAFFIKDVQVRSFNMDIQAGVDHIQAFKKFKAQWEAAVANRNNVYDKLDNGNYPWGQDSVKAAVAIWDPYFYAQRAKNWMTAEGTDAGIATTEEFNDWALYQGVEAYQTTEDAEGNPTTTRLEYQVVRNYQWASSYVANLNKPFTDLATAIDNAKATRNRGMNYLCDRATYKTAIETALATLKQVRDNTSDATIEKDTQTLTAALEALNAATEAFLNSAEIPPVVDIDFSNPFEYVEGKDAVYDDDNNLITPATSSMYVIKGTVGEMHFAESVVNTEDNTQTTFGLGYQTEYTDVLRVGNGEATSEFGDPGSLVNVQFDLWLGNLNGKFVKVELRNAAGERVAGFRYSKYDANVDYNDFNDHVGKTNGGTGMDIRQYAIGIGKTGVENASIYANGALNHFDLTIDYNTNTVQGTLTNGNGAKCVGAALPIRSGLTDTKVTTFVVGSDYNNANRQSWFDNLRITAYGNAPADFEEEITESPWLEHTNAVKTVKTSANSSAIYTISGVRVNSASQKGIYIQNGKKFVVK